MISTEEWTAQWCRCLDEIAASGQWDDFSTYVQTHFEVMPYSFSRYYQEMPERLRREFVVGCYTHHGDSVPECRQALQRLTKNGINELPKKVARLKRIQVFRAGAEPIESAPYRISWTLDFNIALFFLNDYSKAHASSLYSGWIRPEDVIAYTNERKEKEVLQYGSVRNVAIITQKATK